MRWGYYTSMIAVAAALALPGSPARAAADDNPFGTTSPYETCVMAIDTNPEMAFENALIWRDRGGGVPAERCAALALISLDAPGEAASRLDALARRVDAGTLPERAALLAQSGNAWMLAGLPETAEAAFSAGLKLTPRDADMWTDRARARAARQDWADAEADLDKALSFNTSQPETYVLRAAARQAQGNKKGYRADINAALVIDPDFPEALVERGTIRVEDGNLNGARADWVQVLLRAPDSPAGETARARIQALEVHDR